MKLLRDHGWSVDRIEGSHHILTCPGREEVISIPVHSNKTLKTGLVYSILKVAGIKLD
ncbi:MAG: type II toxin-antitoxin system HicA family toxin [Armatimonadetes bacterium]|nr:type II toxin-antitoxin system HicA family toxin [Armatimonadota bacterium]